jgi:hypothetical protein
MQIVVRQTVDNEKEIFENLLNRILTNHRDEKISWLKFLGFFSKRGKLTGYKEIQLSPSKKLNLTTTDEQG